MIFIRCSYEAAFNKMFGHLLQLIPFFLYLLQQLFLGFIQLSLHMLLHTDEDTSG